MASKRKSMSTFVKKPEPPDHVPEVPPATQGYVSGYGAYGPMTAGGVFQGQGLYREKCYSNAYIIVVQNVLVLLCVHKGRLMFNS